MAPASRESSLFSSLPPWKTPWSDFALSYVIQAVVVAIAVWVPVLHPEILERPKPDYHAIELVPTPVPVNLAPQKQLRPVMVAKVDPPASAVVRLPAPRSEPKPRIEEPPTPHVQIRTAAKLEPLPPSAPVIPRAIKTNVFSTGSSAPQTINRAPQTVQTGGFGDPNGVPARTTQTRAVNIAQAGGFDLPTGSGYGNGTGGSKGVRGVVASSGFGGGVAVADSSNVSRGTVQSAGFGNAEVARPVHQSQAAERAPEKVVPAEILSKPTPIYTEEARAKHIEGEVLLEVVLEATGKLRVLRVVRGLGHGLDDAAVRAAEQIRFKPALKDGQPSDSTAVLHIIFQLA